MILHPRVQELYRAAQKLSYPNALSKELLEYLKEIGSTQTEAAITLHMGFDVPLEKAEQFVFNSGVWEPEEINDIAYQTLTYLYYKE